MHNPIRALSDFIFIEDKPKKCDIILVPGGSRPEVMEKACELFKEGYAPYILPSGGPSRALPGHASEWEFFCGIAQKSGIPHDRILKEDKAANTFENARFSRQAVDAQGMAVQSALLVCKTYHARRALLSYQAEFNPNIAYRVIPAVDERDIRNDNWFLNHEKIAKVMGEVQKIGSYFNASFEAFGQVPMQYGPIPAILTVELGSFFVDKLEKSLHSITRLRLKFNKANKVTLQGIRIRDNESLDEKSFSISLQGYPICKKPATSMKDIVRCLEDTLVHYRDDIVQAVKKEELWRR